MSRKMTDIDLKAAQLIIDQILLEKSEWGGLAPFFQEVALRYNKEKSSNIGYQVFGLRHKDNLLKLNNFKKGSRAPISADHLAAMQAARKITTSHEPRQRSPKGMPVCRRPDGSEPYPGTTYAERLATQNPKQPGRVKAVLKGSRTAAVELMCIECMGGSIREVKHCTAYACPLWLYRPSQESLEDTNQEYMD